MCSGIFPIKKTGITGLKAEFRVITNIFFKSIKSNYVLSKKVACYNCYRLKLFTLKPKLSNARLTIKVAKINEWVNDWTWTNTGLSCCSTPTQVHSPTLQVHWSHLHETVRPNKSRLELIHDMSKHLSLCGNLGNTSKHLSQRSLTEAEPFTKGRCAKSQSVFAGQFFSFFYWDFWMNKMKVKQQKPQLNPNKIYTLKTRKLAENVPFGEILVQFTLNKRQTRDWERDTKKFAYTKMLMYKSGLWMLLKVEH